jgi:ankyrin repeat protein
MVRSGAVTKGEAWGLLGVVDVLEQLIEAVKAGDVERVAELVAQDPALAATPDADGMTPVRHALYLNQRPALDAMLAADPPLDVLDLAATGQAQELQARLADDPAQANARAQDGFTALHLACFFGGTEAVQALLQAGADPNPPQDNPMGVAPLHSAAAARDNEAVRLLLEAGADANARQHGGYTALDAADQHEDAEMAALLHEHGATR